MLRTASIWLVAVILTAFLAAFLLALVATQLTAEETGQRVLRRGVAEMTDIDALMPRIERELPAAAESAEGDTVRVPSFPIAVELPKEDAATLKGEPLRERILQDAASLLYDDGQGAWTDETSAGQSLERVSAANGIRQGLGLVQDSRHTLFLVLAVLLGLLALLMAGLFLYAVPGYVRLLALGGVLVASSLPLLAAAVALRFAFRTGADEADPFVDGLLELGADSMWVPIRVFLTVSALGFLVVALGSFTIWWEARQAQLHHPPPVDTAA